MKEHSAHLSIFERVLGTKHRKYDNSNVTVQVATFEGTDASVVLLELHKDYGATLCMTLTGDEAEELGIFLISLGARISALNEANLLEMNSNIESGYKPRESFGSFRFGLREEKNAA